MVASAGLATNGVGAPVLSLSPAASSTAGSEGDALLAARADGAFTARGENARCVMLFLGYPHLCRDKAILCLMVLAGVLVGVFGALNVWHPEYPQAHGTSDAALAGAQPQPWEQEVLHPLATPLRGQVVRHPANRSEIASEDRAAAAYADEAEEQPGPRKQVSLRTRGGDDAQATTAAPTKAAVKVAASRTKTKTSTSTTPAPTSRTRTATPRPTTTRARTSRSTTRAAPVTTTRVRGSSRPKVRTDAGAVSGPDVGRRQAQAGLPQRSTPGPAAHRAAEEAHPAHKKRRPLKVTRTSTMTTTTTLVPVYKTNPAATMVNNSTGPTLYCYAVVVVSTMERWLIMVQREQGTGIFGCHAHTVFLDEAVDIGRLPTGPVHAVAIPGDKAWFAPVPNTDGGVWHNTNVFLRAWKHIRQDGSHRGFSWTVKVDPDTVFLPGILQQKLAQLPSWVDPSSPIYFLNCQQWSSLQGPLEVTSQAASNAFFDGLDRCEAWLNWKDWGEDWFVGHCLNMLGVQGRDGYEMLDDMWCQTDYQGKGHTYLQEFQMHGPACYDGKPAFHAYKTTADFLACLRQAAR